MNIVKWEKELNEEYDDGYTRESFERLEVDMWEDLIEDELIFNEDKD